MSENPFLQDLSPEQYHLLSALFVEMELPARSAVIRQGKPATYLYVVVEGGVSIHYKPYDGPMLTLTRLKAGDVFGWSSVIGGPVYTADAHCTTRTRLFRIRGADLRRLCIDDPAAGAHILRKLAVAVAPRWADSQQQVERLLGTKILSEDQSASV